MDDTPWNPYQVPESLMQDGPDPRVPIERRLVRVEGDCLVVGQVTRLPKISLKTGLPIQSTTCDRKLFKYAKTFRLVLDYRYCIIEFWEQPLNRWSTAGLWVSLLSIVFSIFYLSFDPVGWDHYLTIFLIIAGILYWCFCSTSSSIHMLRVVRHEQGTFWIWGFKKEFLLQVEQLTIPTTIGIPNGEVSAKWLPQEPVTTE